MDFPGVDTKVNALKDRLAADPHVEVVDIKHGLDDLADAAFQTDAEELLRFHGELHRQLAED
ncbi:MAG TPA: hypothetical protein VFB99_08420, partial [Vicinamibacterales bacterium]|nr:hypothetical protein [Vicinamibacterales bacterium]